MRVLKVLVNLSPPPDDVARRVEAAKEARTFARLRKSKGKARPWRFHNAEEVGRDLLGYIAKEGCEPVSSLIGGSLGSCERR